VAESVCDLVTAESRQKHVAVPVENCVQKINCENETKVG
jgi:hypothetical protein